MRSPTRVEMNRDRKVTGVSFDSQWLGMVQEVKLTLTAALRPTLNTFDRESYRTNPDEVIRHVHNDQTCTQATVAEVARE
jgi:hypothetical protein